MTARPAPHRLRIPRRVSAGLAVVALLALAARPALANEASRELRERGALFGYNLDYPESLQAYQQAIDADPSDPASYRAYAATIWLHIMFMRGLVTADNYLGRFAKPPASMRTPPADLVAQFRAHLDRALALARAAVEAHPKDADAHYQLGATLGLRASFDGTVGDERLAALRSARMAYSEEEAVLALDPSRADAGLIIGTYRYMVSTLPWLGRMIAHMIGFSGGRQAGIRMIERAAAYPGEEESDARMALVLLYNRERRYDEALKVLAELEQEYPRNRLLWLEATATALRAGRIQEASAQIDAGFALLAHDPRPRMYGEEALWLYERGATRVALGETEPAAHDLDAALAAGGREWVDGRARTELGKLADLAGDRAKARAEYRMAITLGEQDNDPIGIREASRLLKTPYRTKPAGR